MSSIPDHAPHPLPVRRAAQFGHLVEAHGLARDDLPSYRDGLLRLHVLQHGQHAGDIEAARVHHGRAIDALTSIWTSGLDGSVLLTYDLTQEFGEDFATRFPHVYGPPTADDQGAVLRPRVVEDFGPADPDPEEPLPEVTPAERERSAEQSFGYAERALERLRTADPALGVALAAHWADRLLGGEAVRVLADAPADTPAVLLGQVVAVFRDSAIVLSRLYSVDPRLATHLAARWQADLGHLTEGWTR